jgi:hypothetical protein
LLSGILLFEGQFAENALEAMQSAAQGASIRTKCYIGEYREMVSNVAHVMDETHSTIMNRQDRINTSTQWHIILLDLSEYDNHNRAKHEITENPDWDAVREAILSLDGNRRSDMVLEAANGDVMCIGGGQGRYVVSTQPHSTSETGIAAILVNPLFDDDVFCGDVIVGGVETDLSEHFVVGLSAVLQAAKRFFDDGTLEPSLEWELE